MCELYFSSFVFTLLRIATETKRKTCEPDSHRKKKLNENFLKKGSNFYFFVVIVNVQQHQQQH